MLKEIWTPEVQQQTLKNIIEVWGVIAISSVNAIWENFILGGIFAHVG